WVNGNAGSSNAHYAECNSVPYRMVITGLLPGTHTVDIGWDIKSGGSNAIDFITHYNRLQPHGQFNHSPEVVNPLKGLSGINAVPITYPIPAPLSNMVVMCTGLTEPLNGFNILPANEKLMTM